MGGGLIQLVITGQLDSFVSGNPDISFYKYAYKKHTNFSMESINLTFDTNPVLSNSLIISGYYCKISRYGDLLNNLYFCFKLPEIYSNDVYRFRWVNNIGCLIVKNATFTVGGTIIDSVTGEWMTIWNELTLPVKDSINNLTGNVDDLTNPKIDAPVIGIRNNKFYDIFYPSSVKGSGIPSIKSRDIVIPLNFWFCRNPSLALPLLQLQLADIYLNIELESSERLYQVYSKDLDCYVSPSYYNELYSDNINIFNFIESNTLFPHVEANYVYLDNQERNSLLANPINQFLVEQIEILNDTPVSSTANSSITVDLNIHKLTREIIWTLKRDDYYRYNENINYTAAIPESSSSEILDKATIIWNRSNNRMEEKTSKYFNLIQPYQHHSVIPKTGIYSYSFAIYPEKFYPSGSYNASTVNTSLLLYVNGHYNNDVINQKLTKINKTPYNFDYVVKVYTRSYNIFEINSGTGVMKYT